MLNNLFISGLQHPSGFKKEDALSGFPSLSLLLP